MPPVNRLTLALAALAALLAAEAAGWWFATGRLAAGAAAWQRARAGEGYAVSFGPGRRAGWPLRAAWVLPDVAVATDAPGGPAALAWRAEAVRLEWVPWRTAQVTAAAAGRQAVSFGAAPPLALSAEALSLAIPLGAPGRAAGITLTGRGLLLPDSVRIGSLRLRLAGNEAELAVAGAGLPLDVADGSLAGQARWTAPPGPADTTRAAHGQVALTGVALQWASLHATGEATLGLDAAGQPAGTGVVQLTGYPDALDRLVRAGALSRGTARVAATLLGLLARPGPDGTPTARLPLALRGQVLSAAEVPVARVPRLQWP